MRIRKWQRKGRPHKALNEQCVKGVKVVNGRAYERGGRKGIIYLEQLPLDLLDVSYRTSMNILSLSRLLICFGFLFHWEWAHPETTGFASRNYWVSTNQLIDTLTTKV
jgi:hypothetical protein